MRQAEIYSYPQYKRIVRLWNIEGVSLIFKIDSGVIFTNQTGGVSCQHPYEEGILIPFNNDFTYEDENNLYSQFAKLLTNVLFLNEELADTIDTILKKYPETKCAKVDRKKLRESMEAWIYVDIEEDEECNFGGFGKGKAVITWSNSD